VAIDRILLFLDLADESLSRRFQVAIARAGAYEELAVGHGSGYYSNRPVVAGLRRLGGSVADGVLIPDVERNTGADGGDRAGFIGEECESAGPVCQAAEHLGIAVRIVLIEDAESRLWVLALSPPSLITTRTFLSKVQVFNCFSAATIAS